ncbi:MAG: hypothetical protein IIV40_02795, partial [Oscillospiraceae bacterium]|nr:hypothetical protein [Oscillospiraceae bacterium]
GGKAAKEMPTPLQFAPANAVPSRGLKSSTGKLRFRISTAIVQADGGFLFTFFARLICGRIISAPTVNLMEKQ